MIHFLSLQCYSRHEPKSLKGIQVICVIQQVVEV